MLLAAQYRHAHVYLLLGENCSNCSINIAILMNDNVSFDKGHASDITGEAERSVTFLCNLLHCAHIARCQSMWPCTHGKACVRVVFSVWEVISECSEVSVSGWRALSKLLSQSESDPSWPSGWLTLCSLWVNADPSVDAWTVWSQSAAKTHQRGFVNEALSETLKMCHLLCCSTIFF